MECAINISDIRHHGTYLKIESYPLAEIRNVASYLGDRRQRHVHASGGLIGLAAQADVSFDTYHRGPMWMHRGIQPPHPISWCFDGAWRSDARLTIWTRNTGDALNCRVMYMIPR